MDDVVAKRKMKALREKCKKTTPTLYLATSKPLTNKQTRFWQRKFHFLFYYTFVMWADCHCHEALSHFQATKLVLPVGVQHRPWQQLSNIVLPFL